MHSQSHRGTTICYCHIANTVTRLSKNTRFSLGWSKIAPLHVIGLAVYEMYYHGSHPINAPSHFHSPDGKPPRARNRGYLILAIWAGTRPHMAECMPKSVGVLRAQRSKSDVSVPGRALGLSGPLSTSIRRPSPKIRACTVRPEVGKEVVRSGSFEPTKALVMGLTATPTAVLQSPLRCLPVLCPIEGVGLPDLSSEMWWVRRHDPG
jgi:hypothetical protein